MAEWIELGKEVAKLAARPRVSFALWVGSLVLLGVPLPGFLRLDQIRDHYGWVAGLVFLFTFFLWAVEIILLPKNRLIAYADERAQNRHKLKLLAYLNPDEAKVLLRHIEAQSQTIQSRGDLDEISSLLQKGLLVAVPHEGGYGFKPYTVPLFVWQHINQKDVATQLKRIQQHKGQQ